MYTAFGERSRRSQPRPPRTPRRTPKVYVPKRVKSQTEKVLVELSKALDFFSDEISLELRNQFRDKFSGMEQIRYMNMPMLAVTLVYLLNIGDVPITKENFDNERLIKLLEKVIINVNLRDPEAKDILIKAKATVYRYARAVSDFRKSQVMIE